MDRFKRVALITNLAGAEITETAEAVIGVLQAHGIAIVLDEGAAAVLPDTSLETASAENLPAGCDLAITIGGDGTMLRAAAMLADRDIPLLGINRGRLGFLADIPADSVAEGLPAILNGNYVEDERFQLHCEMERNGEKILESDAFNDVIVQKWNIARLIELETYVNGDLLHRQRADGMIVASPTGSTAYALSGGGPILHPLLDALVLVPICPHTLSNRPIVVDGNSTIEIVVATREIDHGRMTCDGKITAELGPDDRVKVYKKDRRIRLIHPADHDHFGILRAKLAWG